MLDSFTNNGPYFPQSSRTTYTTDNMSGWFYCESIDKKYRPSDWYAVSVSSTWETEKLEDKEMRGLYDVYFVNPETEEIVYANDRRPIVADNEEKAKMKAVASVSNLSYLIDNLEDFDIICVRLGDVNPKKKVQEVKIIDD